MNSTIIMEINGVRHKLIETKSTKPCSTCSLKRLCLVKDEEGCTIGRPHTHFRKCKPGE